MRNAFERLWRYIKQLATNKFFGFGLLGLFLFIGAGYYLVDKVMMPRYVLSGVTVAVPNLVERPIEEAELTLEQANLRVEVEGSMRYNPNLPRGIVIDQNPPPQTHVKPGRRIYLTINKGTIQTVSVPDVVGLSRESAINTMGSHGLRVTPNDVRPDSIPSQYTNTITKQYPPPGTQLEEGSRVRLWYSTGRGDKYVAMPDVVGLTAREAQRLLLSRKLRSVIMNRSKIPNATALPVIEQDKQPGTRLLEGTEVRLTVEAPSEEDEG